MEAAFFIALRHAEPVRMTDVLVFSSSAMINKSARVSSKQPFCRGSIVQQSLLVLRGVLMPANLLNVLRH